MRKARDPDVIRKAMAFRTGLSFRELGVLANCTKGTLSYILDGGGCSPDIARRVSAVLRVPVDELFQASVSNGAQPDDQQEAVA